MRHKAYEMIAKLDSSTAVGDFHAAGKQIASNAPGSGLMKRVLSYVTSVHNAGGRFGSRIQYDKFLLRHLL